MLRVGRMIRVLRRLRELRHVDVILGPLGVARVDVVAWNSAGLLCDFVRDSKFRRVERCKIKDVREAGS